MQVRVFSQGDYRVVEIYDENGQMLIRVGFDHEPSQDEIDALLQSLSGGDAEWQP
jgi:selenocysteine lyase/cysteine desulfurase